MCSTKNYNILEKKKSPRIVKTQIAKIYPISKKKNIKHLVIKNKKMEKKTRCVNLPVKLYVTQSPPKLGPFLMK